MSSTAVTNSSSSLSGKKLVTTAADDTVTGLKTFDRDPSAPFAVSAASAVVPNLIAEKASDLEATAWTDVVFSAGNFTGASSMTWTVGSGDVITNKYKVIGKTLIWQVALDTTTIAGTPANALQIAIPTGTFKGRVGQAAWGYDGGGVAMYLENLASHATILSIIRADQANFTASSNAMYVRFTLVAELN